MRGPAAGVPHPLVALALSMPATASLEHVLKDVRHEHPILFACDAAPRLTLSPADQCACCLRSPSLPPHIAEVLVHTPLHAASWRCVLVAVATTLLLIASFLLSLAAKEGAHCSTRIRS